MERTPNRTSEVAKHTQTRSPGVVYLYLRPGSSPFSQHFIFGAIVACRCYSPAFSRIIQENGSVPEFSKRVWPYLLTRVLLPASRHAVGYLPYAAPINISTAQESHPQQSAAAAHVTEASSHSRGTRSRTASSASMAASVGGMHADTVSMAAPLAAPASRGVFLFDMNSWVHTTAPQLFRAAVTIVTGNAKNAAPLGVPTLVAFFEPHVCCRRRRGRAYHGQHASPPRPRPSGATATTHDGDEIKGSSSAPVVTGLGCGSDERGWAQEVNAAVASGGAVAEEAGSTGDGLVSRMALESLGLLVEGLAGQEVALVPVCRRNLSGRDRSKDGPGRLRNRRACCQWRRCFSFDICVLSNAVVLSV